MRTIEEIKKLMKKVNDYWISENPTTGDCAWDKDSGLWEECYFLQDTGILSSPVIEILE